MISRRKSILSKTRRDSVKNTALKFQQLKEDRENENLDNLLRQRKYEDIEKLKINEDDLNKQLNYSFKLPQVRSENCNVKRLIPLDQRKHYLKGIMLKHFYENDPINDFQMFSSLNANTDVTIFESKTKIQKLSSNEVILRKSLLNKVPDKPIEDNSFKSLDNWKQRMLERRKLKISLAQRLHTNPESLLMSRSAQSILFSYHQDDILKTILPYFQSGTREPITHSIWPVQEETKSKLHIQRQKWKPKIPLQIALTGYHETILGEMNETGKELKSSKIKNKNKMLQDIKYKKFLRDYNYVTPDISDLIICPTRYKKEKFQTENTTFLNLEEDYSSIESENVHHIRGPLVLINDELILEKVNDKNITSQGGNEYTLHLHFPATIIGVDETENIYLANRGSCVINYSWKKIEVKRYLKTNDIRSTFFFKINKGIILPDSNIVIPVTFKSKFSGFFNEMWELMTSPVISNKRITFHFHAISLQPDYFIFDRNLIEETIHRSTTNQIAKEIVEDLVRYAVNHTKHVKEIDSENLILNEEEIFRNRNPSVLWNFEKVQELKLFTLQNFEIDWNFSLDSLKQMLIEKRDLDSEMAEPLFEEFQRICQEMNFPIIEPFSKENDLFQWSFDAQNICLTKLMNSIDEAENFMSAIAKQLKLEKSINNYPDVENETSVTSSVVNVIIKDNTGKLSKLKCDQKSTIIESFCNSKTNEVQIILFREKAYYVVMNVVRNLLRELDLIFCGKVD